MKSKILFFSLALFVALHVEAQITPSQYQKIDSLFIGWNTPNHPGGVIGIMQNGKTVFSKSYGLASLEYLVPNSTETIFNTGSVSKQFTAMGIVLLHIQGKLSVDDDIKKHIPELPEFEETITIRHMLHHTSGLRSLHAMLGLAGWRGDDSRTNEDLYRFMENQADLNFRPGEEYLYCNTGYMLMVKIIETVTGEEFTAWVQKSIFEPLGMINTYVEDRYSRVVPNNATSYRTAKENRFERSVEYWGYVGSGNMHSTTNDLLRWLKNFYDPQEGWEAAFEMIQTLDKFNNGKNNNYAFGVILDEFKGIRRIQHGGSIGGFRAYTCTYPDQKISIAVLTNFSSSSPGQKANMASEILLGDLILENTSEPESIKPIKTTKLSDADLEKFAASYWNDKDNYVRKIYLENDTLRYFRSENAISPIIPVGTNEFKMLGVEGNLTVRFEIRNNDDKTMFVSIDGGTPIVFVAFEPVIPSVEDMTTYTGRFYSPELETFYDIYLKDDKLSSHHPRHGDYEVNVLMKDVLEGHYPINIIKYQRDKNGKISGILVTNGRVRNLWFEKK